MAFSCKMQSGMSMLLFCVAVIYIDFIILIESVPKKDCWTAHMAYRALPKVTVRCHSYTYWEKNNKKKSRKMHFHEHHRGHFVPHLFADPLQVISVSWLMSGNSNSQLPPHRNVCNVCKPVVNYKTCHCDCQQRAFHQVLKHVLEIKYLFH